MATHGWLDPLGYEAVRNRARTNPDSSCTRASVFLVCSRSEVNMTFTNRVINKGWLSAIENVCILLQCLIIRIIIDC